MAVIDRAPTMDAYLATLPRGLDSYPSCQQKAGVLRQFLGGGARRDFEGALPGELRALIADLPPITEWLPEVHVTAIYLAHRDAMGSDVAFVDYAYSVNRKLLSGPIYRILFALASPRQVIRGAASRWGLLHRGTELHLRHAGTLDAVLRLSGPLNLIPHTLALAYGTAYRAALELAGARDVVVDCGEGGPLGYTFIATWR